MLQEFAPWFKWLVYDALARLVAAWAARLVPGSRRVFELLGLLDPLDA